MRKGVTDDTTVKELTVEDLAGLLTRRLTKACLSAKPAVAPEPLLLMGLVNLALNGRVEMSSQGHGDWLEYHIRTLP